MKMKSGLVVLVDLFSLLAIAMFSIFVLTQEFEETPGIGKTSVTAYEIRVIPDRDLSKFFGHRPALSELISLQPTLLTSSGDRAVAGQMVLDQTPDSLRVFLAEPREFATIAVQLNRVIHPAAFTANYAVSIQELSPDPSRFRVWSDLKVGEWRAIALSRH